MGVNWAHAGFPHSISARLATCGRAHGAHEMHLPIDSGRAPASKAADPINARHAEEPHNVDR